MDKNGFWSHKNPASIVMDRVITYFVFSIALWAHDGRVIQDGGDGGHPDNDRNVLVEVESQLPGNTRGRLKIHGLRVEDAGTYSCLDKEGAVQPDSVRVVVADGE